jgi:transposase
VNYPTHSRTPASPTRLKCLLPVRSSFYDIHVATNAPIAGEALARIGQLFDIERAAMGRSPQERVRIRQNAARPVIDDLAAFFDASLSRISGKSELAGAIRYARSR